MQLIYPVRDVKISQGFGQSVIDYSRFGLKGHNGIDFTGKIGDEILAAADGTVIYVGYEADGYGHFILIDHGQHVSVYAHLKKILVNVGQRVFRGKQIAEMGSSGNSTGPHLHFGIRPKNYDRNDGYLGYIDPMPFFNHMNNSYNPNANANPIESIGDVDLGRVEIIANGVAIRSYPGLTAPVYQRANKGFILLSSDTVKQADGLNWRLCFLPCYVAEHDGVNPLIAEVNGSGAQ
jgi:murein DD-endopeptidase MepM/ murein hydrolase activator NlpD